MPDFRFVLAALRFHHCGEAGKAAQVVVESAAFDESTDALRNSRRCPETNCATALLAVMRLMPKRSAI